MFNKTNFLMGSVLVIFAAGTIGCGPSFKGVSSAEDAAAIQSANDAIAKAEEANQEAMAAMSEADAALATIQDSKGNIDLNLFKKSSSTSVTTQGLAAGIINKIRPVFDKVFDSITTVKTKFQEARTKLSDALNALSAANPAQAALIAQLQSKLTALDNIEAQFSAKLHSLAGKLDLVTGALDKLFGGVIGMVLDYLVLGDVKDFIMEIKMRLLAL